jgi:hypothetical protein
MMMVFPSTTAQMTECLGARMSSTTRVSAPMNDAEKARKRSCVNAIKVLPDVSATGTLHLPRSRRCGRR